RGDPCVAQPVSGNPCAPQISKPIASRNRAKARDLRAHGRGAAHQGAAPLRRIFRATRRVAGPPMKPCSQRDDAEAAIRRRAAEWLVRRDRGFSTQEAVECESWLADDERHAVALQRADEAWCMLDRISDKTAQISVQ